MSSWSRPSDRTLGCLLGGLLGLLLCCCATLGFLVLPGDRPPVGGSEQPAGYDVLAIVEEDYVNRTFLESTASLPQPIPLTAGRLDVYPHGRADFAVQGEVGPLRPIFRGSVRLEATPSGDLEVVLTQVRVGSLPVTVFVPSDVLDEVNRDVNRQLDERVGGTGLRLVAVSSDETTLRFYLASDS